MGLNVTRRSAGRSSTSLWRQRQAFVATALRLPPFLRSAPICPRRFRATYRCVSLAIRAAVARSPIVDPAARRTPPSRSISSRRVSSAIPAVWLLEWAACMPHDSFTNPTSPSNNSGSHAAKSSKWCHPAGKPPESRSDCVSIATVHICGVIASRRNSESTSVPRWIPVWSTLLLLAGFLQPVSRVTASPRATMIRILFVELTSNPAHLLRK